MWTSSHFIVKRRAAPQPCCSIGLTLSPERADGFLQFMNFHVSYPRSVWMISDWQRESSGVIHLDIRNTILCISGSKPGCIFAEVAEFVKYNGFLKIKEMHIISWAFHPQYKPKWLHRNMQISKTIQTSLNACSICSTSSIRLIQFKISGRKSVFLVADTQLYKRLCPLVLPNERFRYFLCLFEC